MLPWLIALTIGLPWLGALAVLLAGDRRPRAQCALAIGFAAAAALAALGMVPYATSAVALRLPAGGVFGEWTFVPDGLAVLLAAIATVVGCLTVLFSADYMRGEAQLGRYYALVLLFVGAMAGLVLAGSLLLLFLFWELVALCSYALISFHNDDPTAVAAGVRALAITQLGGVGLLAGILTARAYLGSDQIAALLAGARSLPPPALGVVAFGFLIAAAAKSAQVPFHAWLPDAMEAPTPVSALIHAATMVNAGVYLLARFYPAFTAVPGWTAAVIAVGAISALLGAIMALTADDLKRALAYSTISQLGFMVCAVGAGAIFASQFHLLSHAVFKALLFLAAGAAIKAAGTRDMRAMAGLGRRMPFVRGVFVVGALALIGVPFLNGFWSKELVLDSCMAASPPPARAALMVAVGLTALYAFRMVWLVFFATQSAERGTPSISRDSPFIVHRSSFSALGLLALGTLTTWLAAGPLDRLLAATLPFHRLAAATTLRVCAEVVAAPSTALGLAAWWWRERLTGLAGRLGWLARAARADFGFAWLNRRVAGAARGLAGAASSTQTGQLSWNMVGVAGALAIVLALLAWGA